ncbi:amino acid adenylation domain-containing protein [Amycolatopsis marina]|uniref:Amino acid adenylation domain-containing protein n=1 Tax=Amycolatopsis marina TaxID=490629 RepID=A0A1I0XW67_9PSEU|nr:amino acid adenylation domain-containing protein [Amycolatopsis marina]SFB04696.1 amino acid adenylation domain-containing protein [Amycolatopsis marina]
MSQEVSCHVAVYRGVGAADLDTYQRRLREGADLLGGRVHRLWREPVAGPSTGSSAASLRDRESRRNLSSILRFVLLEYEDNLHDLVITADRSAVDRSGLDAIARMVLTGNAGERALVHPAPSSPASERANGGRLFLPWQLAHRLAVPDLVVVIGLAYAWEARLSEVVVEVSEDDHEPKLCVVDVTATAAECRGSVRDQLSEPPGELASKVHIGLAVCGRAPHPGLVDYRPAPDLRHPLSVHASSHGDDMLVLDYWRDEHSAEFADNVYRIGHVLLDGPQHQTLTRIERLDHAEYRRVRALGHSPRTDTSTADCVHELVRKVMLNRPDATALIDGETVITYGQLVDRATRTAHSLHALGVRRGERVGVCLNRSADLVVVLLAILSAGATYVPMDPAYPAERLRLLAEDAGLAVIVTEQSFEAVRTVSLAELTALAMDESPEPPEAGVTPDDPAYVIYTSGSTGKPKGVVIPHRNVARLLSATKTELGFGPEDTWTWFHSVAFDFSVWEIWGCLTTGGRLVVVPRWTSRSPEDFHALLVANRVTVLNQTPSAFTQLLDVDRAGLTVRLVIFGGEPLHPRMLTGWFDRYPETECRLVNMFGITETTVHVTWHTVTRADALTASKSVGRPIPGWSVHVVDEHRRLLPPGEVGEIAVGGDGLALRYLGREELTAARFVTEQGERLYLSGDKGRMRPDGQLEHLGRLDNQIQLRGHRVEPDEIRAVLLADSAVVTAAVVHTQEDPDDSATARLDAYVVLHEGAADGIRQRISRHLPDYMVPSSVTALSALPLTENGKLDISQLPAPSAVEPVVLETDPDASALDTVLRVWRAVFRSEVSPSDDFFTLGGNSLLAVRIARALRDHGHRVDAWVMYQCPNPIELARTLDGASA